MHNVSDPAGMDQKTSTEGQEVQFSQSIAYFKITNHSSAVKQKKEEKKTTSKRRNNHRSEKIDDQLPKLFDRY